MKKTMILLGLSAGFLGLQCTPKKTATQESTAADLQAETGLYATLEGQNNGPDSVIVRFTVTNPTADTLRFTTYHTPFEGMISRFLDVTDAQGNAVSYGGPMVKRVTPPPANTYRTLAPAQSESVTFDLKKGYNIEKAGTYTLRYNGEKISGIANGRPLVIEVR